MRENRKEITAADLKQEVEFIESHITDNPDSPYSSILEGSLKKLKARLNSLQAKERYAKRKKQK